MLQINRTNISEISYINNNSKKPIEPRIKKIESFELPDNSKLESYKRTLNTILIIISILCLLIISKCVYKSYVSSAISKCDEWDNWVTNDWPNSITFEDNESSYYKVQNGLKAYGLNIGWNKIMNTVDKHWKNGGYIFSDSLEEYLVNDLAKKFLFPVANGWLLSILFILLVLINVIYSKYMNEKNSIIDIIDNCNKIVELNIKNKEFNDNKYPELVKKYNEDIAAYENRVIELKQEYAKMYADADKEIDRLNNELQLFEDIISKRYFSRAKDLAEIIEDGRADSLKEALNILKSDDDAAELLAEQKRKNDIMREDLERQREAEKEHNRQMERYAEQQARAAEDEARAAQAQAEAIEKGNRQAKEEADRARREQKYRDSMAAEAQQRLNRAASSYESARYNGNSHNIAHYEAEMERAKGEINRWSR